MTTIKKGPFGTETRTRFAWYPVKLYRIQYYPNGNAYMAPAGQRVWLRQVTETNNVWSGWTAFEHLQTTHTKGVNK